MSLKRGKRAMRGLGDGYSGLSTPSGPETTLEKITFDQFGTHCRGGPTPRGWTPTPPPLPVGWRPPQGGGGGGRDVIKLRGLKSRKTDMQDSKTVD